jgi:hypothetical protein
MRMDMAGKVVSGVSFVVGHSNMRTGCAFLSILFMGEQLFIRPSRLSAHQMAGLFPIDSFTTHDRVAATSIYRT